MKIASMLAALGAIGTDLPGPSLELDGMTVDFETFDQAFRLHPTGMAIMARLMADPTAVLRVEALQGDRFRVLRQMEGESLVLNNLAIIDDAWYGLVSGAVAIGPFATEVQALNGVVLCLAGIPVTPALGYSLMQAKDGEAADVPDRTVSATGFPVDLTDVPQEQQRAVVLAETDEFFSSLGLNADALKAAGVSATIVAMPKAS